MEQKAFLRRLHASPVRPHSPARFTLFFLLILWQPSSAPRVKAQSRPPLLSPPSDIAVVTQETGDVTIFWADAESGAIYSKLITGAVPARLSLKDFSTFFRSPELPAPSALAYREGKLFVCDKKAVALYEIDLESGKQRTLLAAPLLAEPLGVAVSEHGTIAVSDGILNRIIWYEPGKEPRLLDYKFRGSGRLVFAGSELLAVEDDKGGINPVPCPHSQKPKQVSLLDCRVSDLNPDAGAARPTDFGHLCDTVGGSSGSAGLDAQTGRLLGLHHLGSSEQSRQRVNKAVLLKHIADHLRKRRRMDVAAELGLLTNRRRAAPRTVPRN